MNYYIQGDAAKADKIKAAFERNGIDTSANSNYGTSNLFYFSCNGEVAVTQNRSIINIIKTHPNYKELELSVKPKFKVGDRVIHNGKVRTITFMDEDFYDFDGGVAGCRIENQDELKPASNFKKGDLLIHNSDPTCRVLVVDVSEKYGYQLQGGGGKYHLSFTTVENEYHLWSIADAKDGDVLMTTKIRNCPFIYRKTGYNNDLAYYYAGIDGNGNFCEGCLKRTLYHFGSVANVAPATKEQRDLLFKKMKEAGYTWDEKKKELKKIVEPKFKVGDDIKTGSTIETIAEIGYATRSYYCESGRTIYFENQDLWHLAPKKHYDIANFKPFDKVLVRDDDTDMWTASLYSNYDKITQRHFVAIDSCYSQCIPFEGNEALLGTTDMPSEECINW